MPIISIDATFFWQIINFFLLFYIIKKYFKEPIGKIISKRKEKIETELVAANNSKKEAEQLLKEAEAKIVASKKEASEIIKSAQRKAEEEAYNLIKEARESRENLIKSTEFEVTKMKNDAKEELGSEIKDLAAELAEKIIKGKLDNIQEISLIDKFISEVGGDK